MFFFRKFIFITSLYLIFSNICFAQQEDTSLVTQLRHSLQKKYASLGILVRDVADFQIVRTMPGYNGFSVENFRIKLTGDLDDNFGYHLETKLLNTPSILDAEVYYKFTPQLKLDFGLFKLPFSSEFLVSEADIDFVYRSQTVNALALGKQVGVMVSGKVNGDVLSYAGGIFNGNKGAKGNDNNQFLYVGRIVLEPFSDNSQSRFIKIGLNAAQSNDKSVSVMNFNFEGNRLLLGGDVNITLNNFRLYSEAIWGRLKWVSGEINKPFGYQVTAGYSLSNKTQLLARWDSFKEDVNASQSDMVLLGVNIVPADLFKFQLNYAVPVNDGKFKHHQLLFNTQFSF